MTQFFGGGQYESPHLDDPKTFVMVQRPLRRVLAFRRRTIDDVINDPLVKREIAGWYKLHKWVERGIEISALERQWSA